MSKISSINFDNDTHSNLVDLVEAKKDRLNIKQLSVSKYLCQLIEKEYSTVQPPKYGKEKKASDKDGIPEQRVHAIGEQDDNAGNEDQQTFEG